MGGGYTKLPPINERDLRTLLSYNLEEKHIKKMWNTFIEVDIDCNGVWTVQELYRVIDEPRHSMRAPIIESIFFMADAKSEGCIDFQDFLVALSSFCALSKEEILHLFFIIVDKDRNGSIEKEELLDYFSYVPIGGVIQNEPIFPVNNKNALDLFKNGKWESLEFDGLAQLCERFPYISYPAFHVQELYRRRLLGNSFWTRLDADRSKNKGSSKSRKVQLPGSKDKVDIKLPGRCTMQELLEYSRRKTALHAGRRVAKHSEDDERPQVSSSITKDRDQQISRCPLLNMIRNSRCMYYVPYNPKDENASKQFKSATSPIRTLRAEMEMPDLELDPEPRGTSKGNILQGPAPWLPLGDEEEEEASESSSGSSETSEEEQEMAALPDHPNPLRLLNHVNGGKQRQPSKLILDSVHDSNKWPPQQQRSSTLVPVRSSVQGGRPSVMSGRPALPPGPMLPQLPPA